jgi:hypothetical protein
MSCNLCPTLEGGAFFFGTDCDIGAGSGAGMSTEAFMTRNSNLSSPMLQIQSVQYVQLRGSIATQRGTEKASGHVPPIYPISAGGFRPNALVQTPGIAAAGKNIVENQSVDFVARAMH